MDRLEVIAVVNGTATPFVIESQKLESIQMWDNGRFHARMKGGTHEGKPVTHAQFRQAQAVFAYMQRHDPDVQE